MEKRREEGEGESQGEGDKLARDKRKGEER